MTATLATIVYIIGIGGLFYLDRDSSRKVSKGLWIPTIWVLIIGSRSVSDWFQSGPHVSRMTEYMEGSPLDAAIFGVLIIAGVIVLAGRWKRIGRILRANLPLLLYFAWCALSITWSAYPFIATKRLTKAVGDVVMVLVVLTDSDPRFAVRQLLARCAFLLLPVSVLLDKYYPNLGRVYDPWTWTPLYCGVTTFKNLLGMTCMVCGLGSVWSFCSAYRDRKMRNRMRHLAAHGVILLFTLYLFHTSDSMTPFVCFILGSAIMVATMQRRAVTRRRLARVLVLSCIASSLCALFLVPPILKSLGRDPTLTGRTIIWHAVLSLHSNPLIGTGFESFWMGKRLQEVANLTGGQQLQEAHDGYLEVYLNLGWVGVMLLGGLIISGYRNAMACFRYEPQFGRMRLAYFTALLIYSITEAGFRLLTVSWFSFLLVTMALPAYQRGAPVKRKRKDFAEAADRELEAVAVYRDSSIPDSVVPSAQYDQVWAENSLTYRH